MDASFFCKLLGYAWAYFCIALMLVIAIGSLFVSKDDLRKLNEIHVQWAKRVGQRVGQKIKHKHRKHRKTVIM